MNIDNHLAQIRQRRGYSAAELAKRVKVSRQTIYAIEAGSYIPNTVLSLQLARVLEVGVEDRCLEFWQQIGRDEVVEDRVGDQVADVFAEGAVSDASPQHLRSQTERPSKHTIAVARQTGG